MKKTFIQFAATALMAMTLLACGKEDIKLPEVGESVTFTVQTDCVTKALGDNDGAGANVNRCKVAVYMLTSDSSAPYKIYDKPEVNKHNNLSYSFTVNLLVQQTYQIVVWVDKAGLYDVNDELTLVTRKSGDVTCNSDAYDAFYASVPFVHGTDMTAIEAKRPFAQLNLITQDLDPAAQPTEISLTYASPQSFNPLTATVGTEMTSVTYKANNPYYSSTKGTEHTLAMNYVFAAAETQTILPTVKLTALKGSTTVETQIANVPVQQNYRTNITGKLLTTSGTTSVNLSSTFVQ